MTGLALSPRTRKRVNARALDALTWVVLLVMLLWVAVWWRTFRRDLEVAA